MAGLVWNVIYHSANEDIHSADIGGQVGSVVEVVFDYTKAADDFAAIQTEKPPQLSFLGQISLHAFQIGFLGNAPLAVEPACGNIHQFGVFPKGNVVKFVHGKYLPV